MINGIKREREREREKSLRIKKEEKEKILSNKASLWSVF